jgi:hypothetical protein
MRIVPRRLLFEGRRRKEQLMGAAPNDPLQYCWEEWLALWRTAALIGVGPCDAALSAFVERSKLLPRRMAALGLNPNAAPIDPAALLELMQHCAACESDEQCEWDLREDPGDPAWQDYCPNSARLRAMRRAADVLLRGMSATQQLRRPGQGAAGAASRDP